MKKNHFRFIILSIICLLTLSSCGIIGAIGDILGDAVNSGNQNNSQDDFEFDNYEFDASLNDIELNIEEGKAGKNNSLNDYYKKKGITVFPSTGTKNLLVIPVYFNDFTPESQFVESREEARQNIYNVFFGEDSSSTSENKTGWESVSSYYKKSSYGQFELTGEVTDWFPIGNNLLSIATAKGYSNPSNLVLRKAVSWFKEKYPNKISQYDSDNDGYLDGVVLVYANPSYANYDYSRYAKTTSNLELVNDLCWAFTTWDTQNSSLLSPVGNVYMFASYSFLWEGNYTTSGKSLFNVGGKKLADAHTFIHEFGHMMGLDDYYSYDEDKTSPLGRLDMMDYNIGGHNPYSKYLLGWVEPKLITSGGTYELNSFVETGEALLIPASLVDYSYSAFDEYLLIEYYTPTGNNKKDAKEKYMGLGSSYPYFYTQEGIRILHVDSRLIVYNRLTKKYSYSKTVIIGSHQAISIAASNTPSESILPSYKLISLISNRGITDYFKKQGYASNSDLFHEGNSYKGLNFNSKTKLHYEIKVDSISDNKAKITINDINEKED